MLQDEKQKSSRRMALSLHALSLFRCHFGIISSAAGFYGDEIRIFGKHCFFFVTCSRSFFDNIQMFLVNLICFSDKLQIFLVGSSFFFRKAPEFLKDSIYFCLTNLGFFGRLHSIF